MQTVYDARELAERWNTSYASVRRMEQEGKLHRLTDLPGVKYSAAEVLQMESIGREAQALTAWERKKLQAEIKDLQGQVKDLQDRLLRVQMICRGSL